MTRTLLARNEQLLRAPGATPSNYDVTADGKRFLMIKDEAPDIALISSSAAGAQCCIRSFREC